MTEPQIDTLSETHYYKLIDGLRSSWTDSVSVCVSVACHYIIQVQLLW